MSRCAIKETRGRLRLAFLVQRVIQRRIQLVVNRIPIGEVIDLVKNYARQETLAPMRGAGRWRRSARLGRVLLGVGTMLLVLGLLRLVQNEFGPTFEGRWMSLLPYVAALFLCVVVIGIAISRNRQVVPQQGLSPEHSHVAATHHP